MVEGVVDGTVVEGVVDRVVAEGIATVSVSTVSTVVTVIGRVAVVGGTVVTGGEGLIVDVGVVFPPSIEQPLTKMLITTMRAISTFEYVLCPGMEMYH